MHYDFEILGIKNGLQKSLLLDRRAKNIIPSGCQLLSRSSYVIPSGVYPIYIQKGEGCRVWDVDGNEYIDMASGFGAVILGYAHPEINRAIRNQIDEGLVFSLENPLQVELAELLTMIPSCEMARFGKHGSDATGMAIKCARAYTGREKVAYCQGAYHGWHDWFIADKPQNKGIPECYKDLLLTFKYNSIKSLEDLFSEHNDIACVILEPMHLDPPLDNFLQKVIDVCHKNNSLVVFDEIITGFRFGLKGAQDCFQVTPDLSCFGKAMANGLPISALVGKKEFMKAFDFNGVFYSSTFGSEVLSMAAAVANIRYMADYHVSDHIWVLGEKFKTYCNQQGIMALENGTKVYCKGYPPLLEIVFEKENGKKDLLAKSYFLQETAKLGVLFGPHMNLMQYSHTEKEIIFASSVARRVLNEMRALEPLSMSRLFKGEEVKEIF